ncbi:pyridoxal phosphate-dependent enzyme beta subunit [Gloeopeniophorella convolvens]|nr:pyridoxal phosphate-dependent enzyme beta subunit [Gloeopeniophorella convolvens]
MAHRTILSTALDAVGETPLIHLDRIAEYEGLKCNLLGKLESVSVAGSVKDREDGLLVPGQSVIIEPTSGNLGIALAMAGAIKGYPVVIVMSQKMSMEKEIALRTLGAEVVRTPIGLSSDSLLGHIPVSERLQRDIPGGVILDQYSNPHNPLSHELGTAAEIIDAIKTSATSSPRPSSGKLDVFLASTGTGGTLTGIAHATKKRGHNPACKVIGVDVKGSLLALPTELNTPHVGTRWLVEGIGYDVVPESLTREPGMIDLWIKTGDDDAFGALKLLHRREGLLVGGSSGSALAGALKWLKETEDGRQTAQAEGANVVIMLPDGIRNYIGKEWFRDLALGSETTEMAGRVADILRDYVGEPGVAELDKTILVNGGLVGS